MPLLLERFLPLLILVLAYHRIELPCQLIFLLDLLQRLDPRLRQLVVMRFMITIRDYVELSGLHGTVCQLLDSHFSLRWFQVKLIFCPVTLLARVIELRYLPELSLPEPHPHGASLLPETGLLGLWIFRIIR